MRKKTHTFFPLMTAQYRPVLVCYIPVMRDQWAELILIMKLNFDYGTVVVNA